MDYKKESLNSILIYSCPPSAGSHSFTLEEEEKTLTMKSVLLILAAVFQLHGVLGCKY